MTKSLTILIGRLGKDPEIRYSTSGMAITNFSLATETRKKGQSGDYENVTQWHNVVCFGRTAEVACEYLSKGRQAYIEGTISYESWEDDQGDKKYMTKIIANQLILLGGKNEAPSGESQGTAEPEEENQDPDTDDSDDLPF